MLTGITMSVVLEIFTSQSITSSVVQNVYSVIGLIVFSVFNAYDVQRLKREYHETLSYQDKTKSAIIGGLSLYINFINLFWSLLRLTGGRK
jgi:FtsH-binding integral membrane protein